MNGTLSFLDGNAAAGELREIFAVDVTTASGQCTGCGRTTVLADVASTSTLRIGRPLPGMRRRSASPRPGAWSRVAGPSRFDRSRTRDARRHMT